jgi:hypothetical protein
MSPRCVVLAVLLCTCWAPASWAAIAPLRGVVVDVTLDDPQLPSDFPSSLPLVVRLLLDEAYFAGPSSARAFERLERLLALYEARHIRTVVSFGAFPPTEAGVEPWREFVRAVTERTHHNVAGYQIGAVGDVPPRDVDRYVYLLKLAAVQIAAIDSDVLIIQGGIPSGEVAWEESTLRAGIASYINSVAIQLPRGADADPNTASQPMTELIERVQSTATIILGPVQSPSADMAPARLLNAFAASLGSRTLAIAVDATMPGLSSSLAAVAHLSDILADDVVRLDEASVALRITDTGGADASAIQRRLLFSPANFNTFLIYWGDAPGQIDVGITSVVGGTPSLRNPLHGQTTNASRLAGSADGKRAQFHLPVERTPLILDLDVGTSGGVGEKVNVQSEALPSIEAIIFRYQQARAAQDALVHNYVATVRIEQHFRPSPAEPAYNLITDNRLFSDGRTVEWEELRFELNGATWTKNRPSFPLVQPEKVLSLALDLHLNQDYSYRLAGVGTVDDRPAYVVRFEPIRDTQALYRGTIWIDRGTYARLRVQAVQTHLTGPVTSNDETQTYTVAATVDDRPVWLLNRLTSRQIFLIAGRSILVEREVRWSEVAVNVPDFESQRAAARDSDRVMYRDTDAGVRYLLKKGENRVVSERLTTSARAFAMGAYVDPSLSYPLPIGGLNILDFNFLNRGMQLALLYGGVVAIGNVQRANLLGGKLDASLDFFVLGVKSTDDVFGRTGRRTAERVARIPVSTGINVGYQLTPFHKVTGRYELHYDAYFRDDETDPTFVVPTSTLTNGYGAGYEFRRRGYSALVNMTAYRRTNWRQWGFADPAMAPLHNYVKFDAGLTKDVILSSFQTLHFSGTYYGGRDLDRFSMYTFGMFDPTRMRGVPSALRLADLGLFRGSYSFNVFDQYRFDLFVDHAMGRRDDDPTWRPLTGTGVRVNLRTPLSTILQVEYGKSFQPEAYRGAGSNVLQIMLLKPL